MSDDHSAPDALEPCVCDNCGTEWLSTDGRCHLCRKGTFTQSKRRDTAIEESRAALKDKP